MQAVINNQFGVFSPVLPLMQEGEKSNARPDRESRSTPFSVLIVEASAPLAKLVANALLADDSSVKVSLDLESGLKQFAETKPELMIVDLDLAGAGVPAFLRDLRSQYPETRILAMSSKSGIEDMVTALDNGADDYLSKPFSLLELMARVRAIRRRAKTADPKGASKSTSLKLHRDQCRVERDGRLIDLTPREFTLLDYFMQNPGKTLSRALLTQEVWNMPSEGNTNIVDVYIKYLRDKVDGDHEVKLIRTVRGMGYSYQAQA